MSFDKLPPGTHPEDLDQEIENPCDRCYEDPCRCDKGEKL